MHRASSYSRHNETKPCIMSLDPSNKDEKQGYGTPRRAESGFRSAQNQTRQRTEGRHET